MRKELNIVYYHVEAINAAKYNPRSITEGAKKGLSSSLTEFDLLAPLILNIRDECNTLVSGHRRMEDLIEKGFTELPIVEVSLDEAKEKALNLTMNNLKNHGFFNDSLSELLSEINLGMDDKLFEELNLKALKDISDGDDAYYAFLNVNRPDLDFNSANDDWVSDLTKIDNVDEKISTDPSKITITCNAEDKDEVLIYLKQKFMESSFEGVHVK